MSAPSSPKEMNLSSPLVMMNSSIGGFVPLIQGIVMETPALH